MRKFEKSHPILLLIFYIAVITLTMFSFEPIVILLSLVIALIYQVIINGFKKTLVSLAYIIPILILITITNPLFGSQGETVLFYLKTIPYTKESLVFGFIAGSMLIAVFYWFRAFHHSFTKEKIVYVFGGVAPSIALILSMSFAFGPKMRGQFRAIDEAQETLGIYTTRSYLERIKNRLRIFMVLFTWSLESSMETSESMRARGYGLRKRTSYHNFKWYKKDTLLLIIISLLLGSLIYFIVAGYLSFNYYPLITVIKFEYLNIVFYCLWISLLLIPLIVDIKERVKWNYIKSKI